MLFGWELVLAFILVSTVYACAIGSPNFGNIAPLAVGVSLVLDLLAAAAYSGGGVSPVRVLGPAIVFHCNWNTAWVYMLGGMWRSCYTLLFHETHKYPSSCKDVFAPHQVPRIPCRILIEG